MTGPLSRPIQIALDGTPMGTSIYIDGESFPYATGFRLEQTAPHVPPHFEMDLAPLLSVSGSIAVTLTDAQAAAMRQLLDAAAVVRTGSWWRQALRLLGLWFLNVARER